MRCEQCELDFGYEENESYSFCTCCDRRIYIDDGYYVEDEIVCPTCFQTECFICDRCGEAFFNINQNYVRSSAYEDGTEEGEYLCRYCFLNQ